MKIVGNRAQQDIRLRMPTQAEIAANLEAAMSAPRVILKGVYRYRSHKEANEAMEQWEAAGMVERFRSK